MLGKFRAGDAILIGCAEINSPRVLELLSRCNGQRCGESHKALQESAVRFLMAAAGRGGCGPTVEEPDCAKRARAQEPRLRLPLQRGMRCGRQAIPYQGDFTMKSCWEGGGGLTAKPLEDPQNGRSYACI